MVQPRTFQKSCECVKYGQSFRGRLEIRCSSFLCRGVGEGRRCIFRLYDRKLHHSANSFLHYRIRVSKALAAERAWQFAQKSCAPSIVRSIPLSLWKRKSCSAEASTIYESHLHRTKVSCTNIFCAICQAHSAARAFDTRILIGNYATAL